MHSVIQRHCVHQTLAIGTTAAASTAIDWSDSAGGTMEIPANETYVTLTFYSSYDGVTYLPVYDSANAALTRTVAHTRAYAIPDELFGSKWIKIVGNAAGAMKLTVKS